MGYTTDFEGSFQFNKALDSETLKLLQGLAETRRMKRDRAKLKELTGVDFGIDGEFFIDGGGDFGQDDDDTVLDHNAPPKTQPGLWCQWAPNSNGTSFAWNGTEKFYNYVEWLEYLIAKVLAPRGYELNGVVTWQGEENSDMGKIIVKNNVVKVKTGRISYR